MSPLDHLTLRIETHLAAIYGEGDHSPLVGRLIDTMRFKEHFFEPVPFINHWSEKDVALITYGDSIVPTEKSPTLPPSDLLSHEAFLLNPAPLAAQRFAVRCDKR